jgi:hypothetical protein
MSLKRGLTRQRGDVVESLRDDRNGDEWRGLAS